MKQKFKKYDHVRIAADLGTTMEHFTSDCDAIVMYSYDDEYGCGDELEDGEEDDNEMPTYCLYVENEGETSWYDEHQLTLIQRGRAGLLKVWKKRDREDIKEKSDLTWIFLNGKKVLKEPTGASIEALAACISNSSLWGDNGEGFTYYVNACAVLELARPFLLSGSLQGWKAHCKELNSKSED